MIVNGDCAGGACAGRARRWTYLLSLEIGLHASLLALVQHTVAVHVILGEHRFDLSLRIAAPVDSVNEDVINAQQPVDTWPYTCTINLGKKKTVISTNQIRGH